MRENPLLANLVHELGRPLGALASAIHALQSGADQDPQLRRELLDGMSEEICRLQRLLEDLSHINGASFEVLEMKPQAIPMREWLLNLLSTWREEAQHKQLHWEVNLDQELPILKVDPDRLAQAVGNLVSNAIRYTPTGGTVAVSAGADLQSAWIKVEDTGPGIPPEEQEHVFTPFYRGKQNSRTPQGMGLGLSIARDLILAHGGHLELASSPGKGSCFTIRLPIESPSLQNAESRLVSG